MKWKFDTPEKIPEAGLLGFVRGYVCVGSWQAACRRRWSYLLVTAALLRDVTLRTLGFEDLLALRRTPLWCIRK